MGFLGKRATSRTTGGDAFTRKLGRKIKQTASGFLYDPCSAQSSVPIDPNAYRWAKARRNYVTERLLRMQHGCAARERQPQQEE